MGNRIITAYLVRIIIAVFVLLLGSYLYLRLDLSRNQSYSLSRHSREAVRGLKDRVLVKVYASRDLPPDFSSLNRDLKDMLSEFARESRGKLHYEYVRASGNDELIALAQENQISPYTVHVQEEDELVSKQVVLGVTFEAGGRADNLVLLPGMESKLEYQLMKKLGKVDQQPLPDLLVFADSLSLMYQYNANRNELATFFLELTENYNVVYTDLKKAPAPHPVMLCLGVIDTLSTQQLYHLDQYLLQGGKVVLTQDRVGVYTTQYGNAVLENPSNLFSLLEHYGFMIKPNIVLDRECEIRQGGGMGTQIPYPFFPLVRGNDNYPYTKGFDRLYIYFASELALMPDSKLKLEPVLTTSDKSNRLMGPVFQIETAINQGLDPGYLNQPPITIAARISGRLESRFAPAAGDTTYVNSTDKAELIVFGDSELPLDFSGGAFVVLNAIDHFLGRPEVLRLRSRNPVLSQLGVDVYMRKHDLNASDPEATANSLRLLFQVSGIFFPSLLLILFGLVLMLFRPRYRSAP
jgi:ABC-type uncharacterized transport system involved in gliding motility auxiliary subunit